MRSSRRSAPGEWERCTARDPKLKRDVALQVLPDAFVSDPEWMTRFQREPEVLAALNHPEVRCEDLRERPGQV